MTNNIPLVLGGNYASSEMVLSSEDRMRCFLALGGLDPRVSALIRAIVAKAGIAAIKVNLVEATHSWELGFLDELHGESRKMTVGVDLRHALSNLLWDCLDKDVYAEEAHAAYLLDEDARDIAQNGPVMTRNDELDEFDRSMGSVFAYH